MDAFAIGLPIICVVLPEPSWWAFGLAILTPVIGSSALYFAHLNLVNARTIARNKATLDLIEKKESTEYYRAVNERFSKLRLRKGFVHLNAPRTKLDKADRQAVIDYLNHYELIAMGIERRILDGGFYKAWMIGPFVRDWNAASPWIQNERWRDDGKGDWEYRATIFGSFQKIACLWSKDAIVLDHTTGKPVGAPVGPGDEALPSPRPMSYLLDE
ncbi:MAG: DUF4760 domain-containing protein [Sphingomonadaceae bacterium]